MNCERYPRRHFGIGIVFSLFLLLQPAPVEAGQPHVQALRLNAGSQTTQVVSTPFVLEAWSWRTMLAPVESALGSRRHMLQLGMVGMCIGLYILMRK
jgi:hypothetical protein